MLAGRNPPSEIVAHKGVMFVARILVKLHTNVAYQIVHYSDASNGMKVTVQCIS